MVKQYSKAADGNISITQHFKISEFACNDGADSILLDDKLPCVLQRIRDVIGGKPVRITSGYRTPEYNAKNGGAPNSYHTRGMAADIIITGVTTLDMCRAAETALAELKIPGGICYYVKQAFIHVDVRDVKWRGQNDGDGKGERTVTGWAQMTPAIPIVQSTVQSAVQTTAQTGTQTAVQTSIQPAAPNDEVIWGFLKEKGLNDYAIAGLMGNIFAESGFKANVLQHSCKSRLGHTDETYTAAVDNGTYTNFAKDSAGYGLVQWTFWTRKQALLDYAKAEKKSIGDLNMQLGFLWRELQGYTAVMAVLRNAESIREASDIVLIRYEQPADQSETAQIRRAGYGQTQYDKFTCPDDSNFDQPEPTYNVRVTATTPVNIRTGPGTNFTVCGTITDKGVYTIYEEADGAGATKWGKVIAGLSGAQSGWISLDYTVKEM